MVVLLVQIQLCLQGYIKYLENVYKIKGKWNVDYAYAERVEPFFKEYNLDIKLEYGKFPDRTYDSPREYGDNTKIQKIINNK